MHVDYYQNIVYPLQDKVLEIVGQLFVEFYLTGGTALSRAYLHHRHSDDLDFFINGAPDFKQQANAVINALSASGLQSDVSVADESYVRVFIQEGEFTLKLDFVNDIPYRYGTSISTKLFKRTDNILNILSNKLTALSRYTPKDVVDIVFICKSISFSWDSVFNDAVEKDLWVNPVNIAEILEQFPVEKLIEIAWIDKMPSDGWFMSCINQIIPDILKGKSNSLATG